MMASWKVVLTALYLMYLSAPGLTKKSVTLPPAISQQSAPEVAFKPGETVTLPCVAVADPKPVYKWKKDDQPLTMNTIHVKQPSDFGTIVINETISSDEGVYQCIATNSQGSAVSIKTVLKKAVMDPFPTVKEPKIHRPVVGMPLTLDCQPPLSYPKAAVYWGKSGAGNRLTPIDNNERVSLDYEGNLHFANVRVEDGLSDRRTSYVCASLNEVIRSVVQGEDQRIIPIQRRGNLYFSNVVAEDSLGGVNYLCILQNEKLRSLVQGDDQQIIPQPITGTPRHEAPKLMWPKSNTNEVALQGESKKLKCIFSGYPTPTVNWTRLDAPLPPKVILDRYGQEMTIPDTDYTDVGSYKCTGINSVSEASRTVTLRVESPPYWKDGTPPTDVNTSEEEYARFDCQAIGQPKPEIAWFINGIPVQELPLEQRRTIGREYLIYRNVTKTDAQVIQCNASNTHGYIFANAFLNVLAEPPGFIDTPQAVVRVAERQSVILTCKVFGAPKPTITWKRADIGSTAPPKEVSGDRFILENSGNLKILNVKKEDEGTYFCTANNKFGHDVAGGNLLVRNRTMITEVPVSQTVNASTDVILHCSAITDADEKSELTIEWLKNNKNIKYEGDGSISMNTVNNTLKITQAQVSHSGNYTCNASNKLDADTVTVKLTVKGRPEPPQSVHFTSCSTSYAAVAWTRGKDNNDPIAQYIVYYNRSFDEEPDKYHTGPTVLGEKVTTRIPLRPWTNYTFHVKAKNDLGLSDRSNFSPICVTPPSKPFRHPTKVCTEIQGANELTIVWERMLRPEHNGEGFRYVVTFKLRNRPEAVEEKRIVTDWRESQLVIGNQDTFQEYEIYVQAENNEGLATENPVKRKIGYSGQGTPLDQPQNFRINNQTLNSTSVEFLWDPVDTSPKRIRGFFRGYQIRFWKSDKLQDPQRVEDVILHSWNPCPDLVPSVRYRRSDGEEVVKGHTNRLWPSTRITAGVLVLNAGKSGQLSDTLEFTTPEGVPSMVLNFRMIERGSHHMKLAWDKPEEPNGILRKYDIEYRKAPPAMDTNKLLEILNPEQRHKKIRDLQNDTKYIIYIYALTNAGRSPVDYIEESTLPSSAPSQPVIADMAIGDGSVNVSWNNVADANKTSPNPGNSFFLEYRNKKAGSDNWERTDAEDEHNWINVTDLEREGIYEFRVVAKNSAGDETRSDPKIIIIRPEEADVKPNAASAGLFIGLMCAIAFLLLILLLICLIKRNRGGKYAVHEKEKLRGHDSARDDDEAGFGEYTRTPHMELKYSEDLNKSRGSLESEEKPLDSESDSLGEYEDPDPSKFNEDGSFIGQYGGKKKSGERLDHDATTPSALSTFV